MEVTEFGMINCPFKWQPLKALSPIVETDSPMVIDVKEQYWKTCCPIAFTEFPIINVPVNPLQLENALNPISVTESGIVREPVNPEHL